MIRLTEAHLADFFSSACATIGQTPDKINDLYPDASFNLIQCVRDSVLEITTEYFTLSCLIGKENRCESAYIFINKEEEFETVLKILRYCKNAYQYSYLLKMWINNSLGIDLQIMDECILLSITKIKPLPDDLQMHLDSEFALN